VKNLLVRAMEQTPAWQDNLKASCLRVGFGLHLTRAMCEFLSAVADDVHWDRAKYGSAQAFPDNLLATSAALFKRGMIRQKSSAEIEAHKRERSATPLEDRTIWEWTHWELTPAGEHVVALLKLTGMFVSADAAIEKKSRRGGAA
jgi:hypothetical protein